MPRARALLVMLLGGGVLLWGAVRLQRTFIEERDLAKQSISTRREALRQYARVVLERRLREKMDQAMVRIDAALANPLLPDTGLLAIDGGEQRLPRTARYFPGPGTPAGDWYRRLRYGEATGEGLFGERLALLAELKSGLDAADREAIAGSVRAWLNHQSRNVLPVVQEVASQITFVELLIHRTTPDSALLQALLRDGLRGSRGRRIAGLQPLLLTHRDRFSERDFDFLAGRVSSLSRSGRVVHDDFDEAAKAQGGARVPVPEKLEHPAIIDGGRWYAIPMEVAHVRGVGIDLAALLGEITQEMRSGALLMASDTIRPGPAPDFVASAELPLEIHSPALDRQAASSDRRYAVKTATGMALGMLSLAIAALVGLLYRRERKYLEGKANFVATVSHELRTPIASLRLMGETLERRLAGIEAARDFPQRIVGEAERLNFLVENILSFNRLEKASVSVHRRPVALGSLIEAVRDNAALFTRKPVDLRIAKGAEYAVSVDGALVQLLLSNLIQNSCKYNERERVEIEVSAFLEGGRVTLWFSDNGTGIERSEWESVFTEFVRSRRSGASGFGLGLALCRRIVTLHEGTLRIVRSSEAGTTFELVLPAARGMTP